MAARGVAPLAPWRWPAAWLHGAAAVALAAWLALQCFGVVGGGGIAGASLDRMQQHRLWASAPDPRILIVDVDERSLAEMAGEFGRWPWPRDTLATVLEQAEAQGAAAVVFDILFADPDRLHPGGDRALESAVRASRHAFFPVVRLQPALDARSELKAASLPGLVDGGSGAVRVALIPPFMQAMVDSGRLGTHSVTTDADGRIRRFPLAEALPDGGRLLSMPAAVARHLGVAADDAQPRLVAWRAAADAYPRVPFVTAWRCAEGAARPDCPDLAGRIVIVGASAPSLHDVKTSPLAAQHLGVDILATLIDNALHRRALAELPPPMIWGLGVGALALAWRVVRRGRGGASALALWALPSALLAIGWASLHSEALFVDLGAPAAAVLSFMSAVKLHDGLRRRLFAQRAGGRTGRLALAVLAPSAEAERAERAVMDAAARAGLRVSGSAAVCGEHGASHAAWAIWGLADEAAAHALARELPAGLRAVPFEPSAAPQCALHLALASALAAPATPPSPPPTRAASEKLHVSSI